MWYNNLWHIHRGNKESTCVDANGYNFWYLFSDLPRSPFPGGSSSSVSSGALPGAKKNGCLRWIRISWMTFQVSMYIYIYLFPFCFWSQGLDINFQCLEKTRRLWPYILLNDHRQGSCEARGRWDLEMFCRRFHLRNVGAQNLTTTSKHFGTRVPKWILLFHDLYLILWDNINNT